MTEHNDPIADLLAPTPLERAARVAPYLPDYAVKHDVGADLDDTVADMVTDLLHLLYGTLTGFGEEHASAMVDTIAAATRALRNFEAEVTE